MDKLKKLFSEKRFLLALGTVVAMLATSYFGVDISGEQMAVIISVIVAAIVGGTASDMRKAKVKAVKKADKTEEAD